MAEGTSNIRIDNVKETVKALDAFAPEIRKRMNTVIRQALNKTKQGAQQRYPKGAWSVNINNKKLLGSISARGGGVRATRWGDSAPGIRAAIFEFAGTNGPGKTPQAQGLIKSLTSRYGQPGRFLWDSWDESGAQALASIEAAVKSAESELQAKLNSMGESF